MLRLVAAAQPAVQQHRIDVDEEPPPPADAADATDAAATADEPAEEAGGS